ncbi:hypothetical protein V6N13_091087 [Hibiscus sabdariffa]
MLPYGNPRGRPPEESTPTVIAPQYECPASPTPLEGQSLAKKGKRDLLLVDNGSDDMDVDGVMLLNDSQNGDDLAGYGDVLKVGQSQLHFEIPTLGKTTYASVVDKESTHSDTKKSEEVTVVADMSKECSVPRGADLRTTKEHPSGGGVSNGVTKNAMYMASNPDKRSKAAAGQTRTVMVIPTVAGQSAKAVEHVTCGL